MTKNTSWGGRFEGQTDRLMERFNTSVDVDGRLWAEDIAGSRAHARMLVAQGILSDKDGAALLSGLDTIEQEFKDGTFTLDPAKEDIHMNIEARLRALIGEAAGRLHTARSRNDQVATDVRLWLRAALDRIDEALAAYLGRLDALCTEHKATVMPGYTHLQAAQPVTLALHLGAYRAMAARDRGRFADCRTRMNECPLGACALAGTSFPVDRSQTASILGFDRPVANTMDAVASRDFALEFLSACAITATHLSRLAEEIILWASPQFGFVRLGDGFATGSSIMPQKKNPDAAELIRGKTGRVIGALTALLVTVKGLPLTYNKDLQEDKEPVFDAADTIEMCLAVMTGALGDLTFERGRMAAAAEAGFTTATELADWLVQSLGLPFRQAHHVTGALVKQAEAKGCGLKDLSLADMQAEEAGITDAVYDVLDPLTALKRRGLID